METKDSDRAKLKPSEGSSNEGDADSRVSQIKVQSSGRSQTNETHRSTWLVNWW